MKKTYSAPQAFEEGAPLPIALQPVESNQVRAIGYDDETRTLAVVFRWGAGALYQYPDVSRETFDEFRAAESKGTFFGQHIKPLPFKKYPAETVVIESEGVTL